MKKAFDQTFRDIKREVNKKVLKVPSIEQKVLDATSNEPWGPHGTLLAEIAQASRNYHEYQLIMAVIWKRVNDTGKNWRHVYKALTVLEYLVAHGSERVIDEIKEHAYQIQTLSDFQYIDSNGKDQGNNVRKKSQSLVVLVNDKERISEVRQKAAANRDKYRNTPVGGMYRPGSYSSGGYGGYEDDRYDSRYGSRDEDRNGYGRDREWGYRDDERSGRYGDSYGRDGDWYGKENEDRYGRDGYRDDDYRGRSRAVDDYQYGSRSRSSDRDRERAYEDDGQCSSRGSVAKADDPSQDGRHLDRKYSEQNLGAPPAYEEAVAGARSPSYNEQGGEITSASAPKSSSPPASAGPAQAANAFPPQPAPVSPPPPPPPPAYVVDQKEVESFDEFDPRGSFSAATTVSNAPAPTASGGLEMDLLGSLSESSLALVPSSAASVAPETDVVNSGSVATFVAPSSAPSTNQPFDDPFGDGPFKATLSTDNLPAQPQNVASSSSYFPASNQSPEQHPPASQKADTANNFGGTFPGSTYATSNDSNFQPSASNIQYSHHEQSTPNQDIDILADILPPSGPQPFAGSQTAYPAPTGQSSPQAGIPPLNTQTGPSGPQPFASSQTAYPAPTGQSSPQAGFPPLNTQTVPQTGFPSETSPSGPQPSASPQTAYPVPTGQSSTQAGFLPLNAQTVSQTGFPSETGPNAPETTLPTQSGLPSQPGQPTLQTSPQVQPGQLVPHTNFYTQTAQPASFTGFHVQAGQASQTGFPSQSGEPTSVAGFPSPMVSSPQAGYQALPQQQSANFYGSYNQQMGSAGPVSSPMGPQVSTGPLVQHNSMNFLSRSSAAAPATSYMTHEPQSPHMQSGSPVGSQSMLPASTGSFVTAPQPAKDKFETKSTVWADTLSRGLVDLNISGPKINPLSDIGVDFDAINRKEKRMEKHTPAPVTSTVTMGKAMGLGSGIGRAGAGALRPPSNTMMGYGMGMGMGMGMGNMGGGPGPAMGMGGYGAVNQPMGGPAMGMSIPPNMGMGMNMGVGQAGQMQRPMGFPPGSAMPGGYNPTMGAGNYGQQQYGGGYR